jgi:hypothetical protein
MIIPNVYYDSRVLRNEYLQTPPDPEGSSGSKSLRVPRGCLAITKIFMMGFFVAQKSSFALRTPSSTIFKIFYGKFWMICPI